MEALATATAGQTLMINGSKLRVVNNGLERNLTVAQGLALSASDRCRAIRTGLSDDATALRARADRRRANALWLDTSCAQLVEQILGGER